MSFVARDSVAAELWRLDASDLMLAPVGSTAFWRAMVDYLDEGRSAPRASRPASKPPGRPTTPEAQRLATSFSIDASRSGWLIMAMCPLSKSMTSGDPRAAMAASCCTTDKH